MNVSEVMTRHTSACEPSDSLDRAAGIMWDRDCGAVPVVDGTGTLHGFVTDRDVAMSAYLKGRPLGAIAVAEVMSTGLHCCAPTDPLEAALATMRTHQVHRLPVVDGEGRLAGILALSDVLQALERATSAARPALTGAVVATLTEVRRPRSAAPLPQAATQVAAASATGLMGSQPATAPAATAPASSNPAKPAGTLTPPAGGGVKPTPPPAAPKSKKRR